MVGQIYGGGSRGRGENFLKFAWSRDVQSGSSRDDVRVFASQGLIISAFSCFVASHAES